MSFGKGSKSLLFSTNSCFHISLTRTSSLRPSDMTANHNHSSSCVRLASTTVVMHDRQQRNTSPRSMIEIWGSFPLQTILDTPFQTSTRDKKEDHGRREFHGSLWGPSTTNNASITTSSTGTTKHQGQQQQQQQHDCWRLSLLQVIDSALEVLELVGQDDSSSNNAEDEGNNNDQEEGSSGS